jgi:MFS family permease
MMAGGLLLATTVAINLAGTNVAHFWFALFSLGIGWNFVFVGATSLLTTTYAPEEKAKTQGVNDFLVFSTVAASALTSGSLQHHFGWQAVNLGVIPLILCVLMAVAWMHRREAFLKAERVAANPP